MAPLPQLTHTRILISLDSQGHTGPEAHVRWVQSSTPSARSRMVASGPSRCRRTCGASAMTSTASKALANVAPRPYTGGRSRQAGGAQPVGPTIDDHRVRAG
jgi:hypothetical protein